MRTLCDACESAAAVLFCAADEAALCRACDEKFTGDKPGNIDQDPASQPVDPSETRRVQIRPAKPIMGENQQNHNVSPVQRIDVNADGHVKIDTKMIDLNMKPRRIHGQASNNQEQ